MIDARAKRKRQGAVARDAGARWEQEIKQHHARAEASGLVVFSWHIGPKFTFVRKKKGQIQPVAVGVASADFIGALRDGRYFLAEAKTVASGQRLSRHSDLKPHQRRDLERAARGGGLALLLVQFRETVTTPWGPSEAVQRFAIPWLELEKSWRRLRTETAGPEELRGWEMQEPIYLSRFVNEATQ